MNKTKDTKNIDIVLNDVPIIFTDADGIEAINIRLFKELTGGCYPARKQRRWLSRASDMETEGWREGS